MPRQASLITPPALVAPDPGQSVRSLYDELLRPHADAGTRSASRDFLDQQLQRAMRLESDLPDEPDAVEDWLDAQTVRVGRDYQRYLADRAAGAERRYFSGLTEALHFLRAVAPTKLVDGAWLHGVLGHWRDPRFAPLIRTYLEELGNGSPARNHVRVFQRLLAGLDCEPDPALADDGYLQGTLQLALGCHGADYLPEVIGYNLGYEQLPLHLLITAFELNELGIDPHYFTLHITIDNADTGHARRAVRALALARPCLGDRAAFYRRVGNGYRLNRLGVSTDTLVSRFNPEQELLAILARKRLAGQFLHGDHCRLAGEPLGRWLSDAARLPALLGALESTGWIQRHQPPELSRFWRLLTGDHGAMTGVFSPYELRVLHDWIAGDRRKELLPRRTLSFRARQRWQAADRADSAGRDEWMLNEDGLRSTDEACEETRLLDQRLASVRDADAAMALLAGLMGPASHHGPAGLKATRLFNARYGNAG